MGSPGPVLTTAGCGPSGEAPQRGAGPAQGQAVGLDHRVTNPEAVQALGRQPRGRPSERRTPLDALVIGRPWRGLEGRQFSEAACSRPWAPARA